MAVAMDTTRHVLEALSAERPTNRSTLCRRLELEGDALDDVLTELADCGLVGCAGKRVVSMAVPGVSPEAALLYAALPAGGTTMGNIGLRGRLGFDEETYSLAKQELLDPVEFAVVSATEARSPESLRNRLRIWTATTWSRFPAKVPRRQPTSHPRPQ